MSAGPWIRQIRDDLRPAPDRLGGTLRVTFSALLVAVVMLTFRMPFLYIGPYLVFILSQKEMFLTRAAAGLGLVVALVASLTIYLVAWLAWDSGWLRIVLWCAIFYGGYFLMRVASEPRAILGPLVVVALLAFAFDSSPDPNRIISSLGWLWAILGLVVASTFLTQWLFGAPTGIEVLRRQVRQLLGDAERACLRRRSGCATGGGISGPEEEWQDALGRVEKLGKAGVLSPVQHRNCEGLLLACGTALEALARPGKPAPELAACVRTLRRAVLSGKMDLLPARWPDAGQIPSDLREAADALKAAADQLRRPSAISSPHPAAGFLQDDWKTNPAYPEFALRAMLATIGCYLFMTLVDWNGIHTCMITCAVTALSGIGAQMRKQNLRMVGAVIGGALGMGAVVWVIPNLDSFGIYLAVLAAGTALAAWVSLGGERISYAGWQIGLAFYMTVLQDPHPTTKLDIIRDRWVGIFVGIVAMRAAFVWFAPDQLRGARQNDELPKPQAQRV